MSNNLSELSFRKGIVDNLFEKMGTAAATNGTLSQDDMQVLADEFLLGKANIYGASSFYDFLKPENKDKEVYVCNGSACQCAGTQDDVKKALSEHFDEKQIGHMTCLGRCHENAAFHYRGNNYSAKSSTDIANIIKGKKESSHQDEYAVKASTALLTAAYDGFDEHYTVFQNVLKSGTDAALKTIMTSNLRGRGGAGFPMGFKLDACSKEEADVKFIICNADEGDPGAYSDRYLLEQRPHSVLFGMLVAGYVCGASWGVLYIRAEYPNALHVVNAAIEELRAANLIGFNILESGFNFDFKIIQAQGAYICGEETALINSIEGQRPEVRTRPPYPTQKGLFNKPTVVNNVETLAALYPIFKNGSASYATLGTQKSKGTKLVSLDSFFNKPGIYEVEMGMPLKTLIYDMAGGLKKPVKAMQIGGPLGGIVPLSKIGDLTIDFESFSQEGFLLGHASIVCIPKEMPMVDYLEHLMDFAQYESCGKCFPCRLGTKRAHELLQKAAKEKYQIDRSLFDDLLDTLQEGSLCAHGGGIPLPVKNALHWFADELKPYFS